MAKDTLRILGLQITNYKGIQALDLTPKGNVIKIEGDNEAGKSSAIDAIWSILEGEGHQPINPIRRGADKAEISLDLGDFTAKRTFTEKGTYLYVETKDGFKGSQKSLDMLYSRVTMDPMKFMNMKAAERNAVLLGLTGKKEELEAMSRDRKDIFDDRTLVNREVKKLKGKLSGLPEDKDVKEKTAAVLFEEIKRAQAVDKTRADYRFALDVMDKETIPGMNRENENSEAEIKRLTELIASNNAYMQGLESQKIVINNILAAASPERPLSEIQADIDSIDSYNKDVRDILAARETRKELAGKVKEADGLTNNIKQIDIDKAKILDNAKLPVENVTFEDDQLKIGGTPFEDLSTSQGIKASMKIAMALSPRLRVLHIKHGSELGEKSMAEVCKFANENNCQCWVEIVRAKPSGDEDSTYMVNGEQILPGEDGTENAE